LELHVVFNYSAAGSIHHILQGREAAVARFSDNLSRGPINSQQSAARRVWLDEHLGYDNPDIVSDEDTFWPKVLDKQTSRVAWVSRRSASEHCGFLEYLRRLGDLPTKIIDTTDTRGDDGELFRGTGSIPANHVLSGLLDTARELDMASRADSLALWGKLRAEDSALRVADRNHALLSVPLSFYDQQLLSLTASDWRPMARIVGEILADAHVDMDDLLPFSRLYALVDSGVLASREIGRLHPDVKLVKP
jgi:Protein of unknown function/Domain of unknown function (DUF1835)